MSEQIPFMVTPPLNVRLCTTTSAAGLTTLRVFTPGPHLAVTLPGPPGKVGRLVIRDFFLPQLKLCFLHTGEVTMICLFKHRQRNSVTNTVTTESRISEGEQVPEGPRAFEGPRGTH